LVVSGWGSKEVEVRGTPGAAEEEESGEDEVIGGDKAGWDEDDEVGKAEGAAGVEGTAGTGVVEGTTARDARRGE